MGSALKKRSISAPITPDATENIRGIGSLVAASKVIQMMQILQAGDPVQYPRTPEMIDLAQLGEAFEFLLNNPMLFRGRLQLAQSPRLPVGQGKYLKTNSLQEVEGIDQVPYADIDGAPVLLPKEFRERGTFTITVSPASYPTPNPSSATGATQTGSGSGDSGAIKSGDFWKCPVAGTVGDGLEVFADSILVALVDNPGQTDENWIVADLEPEETGGPVADTDIFEDFTKSIALWGALDWNLEGGTATRVFNHVEGKGVILSLGTSTYQSGYFYAARTTGLFTLDELDYCTFIIKLNSVTNSGFACFLKKAGSSQYGSEQGVGFGWWFEGTSIEAQAGTTTQTIEESGVSPLANQFLKLDIRMGTSDVKYYINNALVATITTNIPTRSDRYHPWINVANATDGLVKSLTVLSFYAKLK